jgi:RNA-directed DNA polymerase
MLRASDLIADMSADMGMLPEHLKTIVRTAPLRYKVFYIPKRSGGMREVAQPAREVKAIQRWLVGKLETQIPVHVAATAYRTGTSIKLNALTHAESNYLLKLDFRNFFPSITAGDIERHLVLHCSDLYEASAIRLIAYVCSWAPQRQPPLRLCIGAPSSPLISNSVMHSFDVQLAAIAESDGVKYTRYADDLALSSKSFGVVDQYAELVASIVRGLDYPRLSLNTAKTVLASRAGRRVVTGVTLTPDFQLSIGRDRKRLIRTMYHRDTLGQLSSEAQQELRGLLAFADSIEPGFSARLRRRAGRP